MHVLFTSLFAVLSLAAGIHLFFPQIFVAHLGAKNIVGIQLDDSAIFTSCFENHASKKFQICFAENFSSPNAREEETVCLGVKIFSTCQ